MLPAKGKEGKSTQPILLSSVTILSRLEHSRGSSVIIYNAAALAGVS
jgi:hypothetical protein